MFSLLPRCQGCCQTNASSSQLLIPGTMLGGKKAAPLSESGGAGLLEDGA